MCFFRKGLKSLEAVEPHVKLVTEKQHIDYQFSGLEDDDGEDGDDDGGHDANDDGELSFDYGQNDHVRDVVSTSRNSMEVRFLVLLVGIFKKINQLLCFLIRYHANAFGYIILDDFYHIMAEVCICLG